MALAPGTRLGPYEITAKLGEGGMGEVYRATDTKLKRNIAIKVLPAAFNEDPERLARFEREAQLLAQLNHPNIAAIHGLEESDGVRALVMELVEGPTLAERLESGPISLNECLSVSLQIAQALEEAHEKGIVHRDLKPQNIKAAIGGTVKVLDFGLAKAFDPAGGAMLSASHLANSPTVSLGGTREGVILGTAAYMAPEQARGGPVDKRADIWAFGVVLYEMLTGERLFAEGSVVDTLSAVMRKEIDLARLAGSIPPRLLEVVRRCIERSLNNRLHDIADARIVLVELAEEEPSEWVSEAPRVAGSKARGRRWNWTIAALVGLLAGALLSQVWSTRDGMEAAGGAAGRPEVRFQFSPPTGHVFPQNIENPFLAVSPDGSTLAFVAYDSAGLSRIWLRRIDDLEAHPLVGTERARSLAWSPDGRAIAFFSGDMLKRLELQGGVAVPICEAPQRIGLAASWGAAGQIIFASVQGEAIYRVSAEGGVPEKIVQPDESKGELRTHWPIFLPDGRGFLYLARTLDLRSMLMLVEAGESPRAVGPLDSRFEFVAPDLMVFAREGALLGQRFDRAEGRLVGAPISIAPAVRYAYTSKWAGLATSLGGTLFFLDQGPSSRVTRFDRSGRSEATVGLAGDYQSLSLTPDGRTLLADRRQPQLGTFDLWITDLERGVETRLTSSPASESLGITLPDGKNIVFSSFSSLRTGVPNLMRRDLTTGQEAMLLPRPAFQIATDVTRDGRRLVFRERGDDGMWHAWLLWLDGEPRAERLFTSNIEAYFIRFSPDGKYVAYLSDDSGESAAYVSPLASPLQRTRLSTLGASQLRWSRDGREIFLLSSDDQMHAVAVRTAPRLEVGATTTLFAINSEAPWLDFDVTPDGRHFIAIVLERSGGAQPATAVLDFQPR